MVKVWSDTLKREGEGIVNFSSSGPSEGSFSVYGTLEYGLFVRLVVEGDASKGFTVDSVGLERSMYVVGNYQVIESKYVGPNMNWEKVPWKKQV